MFLTKTIASTLAVAFAAAQVTSGPVEPQDQDADYPLFA
jgi:hypothetical protein